MLMRPLRARNAVHKSHSDVSRLLKFSLITSRESPMHWSLSIGVVKLQVDILFVYWQVTQVIPSDIKNAQGFDQSVQAG